MGKMTLTAAQQKRLLDNDAAASSSSSSEHSANKPSSEVRIPFTHDDLRRNGTVSGGFIPLILAAIASSVAGGLIERGIAAA